jgi:hypothetical protein
MLKDLNIDQARFIALLARTARTQRDALLGHVAERTLGGTIPPAGANTILLLSLDLSRFLPTICRRRHFAKQLLRCQGLRVRSFMR